MALHHNIAETARNFIVLNRLAVRAGLLAVRAGLSVSAHRFLKPGRQTAWSLPFEGVVEMLSRGAPSQGRISPEDVRQSLNQATLLAWFARAACTTVSAGGVPAEWITTDDSSEQRVVLYLHGGGYISGSPQTHRSVIGEIARATGARVLAPDYRLAPEAPYPAALEDAWTVYWWLLQQGVRPEQLVVAGDSAGGGLTIALLVALRDAGLPLPAGAVCLSPWFDLALASESIHRNAASDYLNPQIIRSAAYMYLADRDPRTPLASPLYADLHGLPPLLLQAGTAEMLLDDSKRFARRASAAGVQVEIELWENMVHVWHFLFLIEPQARQAIQRIGCFVRRQMGRFSP